MKGAGGGSAPLPIAVVGASGRMGRSVIGLATQAGHRIVCAVAATDIGADAGEIAGVGKLGVPIVSGPEALADSGAKVIIDFSAPPATAAFAGMAARSNIAIVSGTTGLDAAATSALDRASERVAVLWEPNMSVGVHVLGELVRQAVRRLGAEFDVEIVETHHRRKVDAPSGTALRLAEVVRDARGEAAFVHGRQGRPGERTKTEVGIHALRGGDVVGDHAVHLLGAGEHLELTHRASSRDLFARGALRAASWIVGKPAGRYALSDVLDR